MILHDKYVRDSTTIPTKWVPRVNYMFINIPEIFVKCCKYVQIVPNFRAKNLLPKHAHFLCLQCALEKVKSVFNVCSSLYIYNKVMQHNPICVKPVGYFRIFSEIC